MHRKLSRTSQAIIALSTAAMLYITYLILSPLAEIFDISMPWRIGVYAAVGSFCLGKGVEKMLEKEIRENVHSKLD